MPRYSRGGGSADPRWITARFASQCSRCGGVIRAGARVFYYPATKTVLCNVNEDCGAKASREFDAMAADERQYQGN